MNNQKSLLLRLLRILLLLSGFFVALFLAYHLWTPGMHVRNGRFDRKRNGIWLQHSWLGTDKWMRRNRKNLSLYRSEKQIKRLYDKLTRHHIRFAFPHVAPTTLGGQIPAVHHEQMKRFLKIFRGIKLLPWIGGAWGKQAFPEDPKWRKGFVRSVDRLLKTYPALAGVHLNIEPCRSCNASFLLLLEETRRVLKKGQLLSVAAYPPPTLAQPSKEVHWSRAYYKKVATRTDQLVVMMYDTGLPLSKLYQSLFASWTREVLKWSENKDVLFGLPAYEDRGVGYHHPDVENLRNSIAGLNRGLSGFRTLPSHYQGVALYSEWVMTPAKWSKFRALYLKKD
jgi:hypothetical protein